MVIGYFLVTAGSDQIQSHVYRGLNRELPQWWVQNAGSRGEDVVREHLDAMLDDDEWCHLIGQREDARRLQQAYARIGCVCDLLVVHLCDDEGGLCREALEGKFLGFDVVNAEQDSALHPAILFEAIAPASLRDHDLAPIWLLEQEYFHGRVNEHGLLDEFADADLLLRLKRALVRIAPEFPEIRDLHICGIEQLGSL
ncbi:MAG: hypothetical protein KDA33_15960 [Phycisphaerales bacterium]|nr:hypothetical protein [Phycisphaerales bacterium]